jgi:hypothetical protein
MGNDPKPASTDFKIKAAKGARAVKKEGDFDQNPAAQSLTARRESEPRRTKCERKEGANRLGASSEWANEALATTLETVLCRFWVGLPWVARRLHLRVLGMFPVDLHQL